MLSFAYPWALCLLLIVPLFFWYRRRWLRRPAVVVASAIPFRKIKKRTGKPDFAEWCCYLAAVLLVLAMSRPRLGDERVIVRAKGIDLILALDMSGSMRAYDISPNMSRESFHKAIQERTLLNRLDTAKREIRKFIEERPNDRIGLIGFADQAYSFAPPTLDHSWLIDRLNSLTPGQIGETTGIAAPIGSAVNRLKDSAAPRRVLVLFTDGTNTAVNRISPEQAAALAKEYKVIIHTVGIGSGQAVAIDPTFGRVIPVQDNFDEPLLKALAKETDGSYFHASDSDGMARVMQEINQLERTSVEQPRYVEYREYAPVLALIAAGLLMLGFALRCRWMVRLP